MTDAPPSTPARFGAASPVLAPAVGVAFALAAVGCVWFGARTGSTLALATTLVGLGAVLAFLLTPPSPKAGLPEAAPAVPAPAATASYNEALETLPDPLLIVRGGEVDDMSDRRIVFANAAARRLPRSPRAGALLVTVFRRPEVLEAVDEALFGGGAKTVALEDGVAQIRFWQVFAAPLPAREPQAPDRFALLFLRDETEAKRAERSRADFLANASHELRTPLASLSGYIETLRGHAKDDPIARERFLTIMEAQAARMSRLTEDLLSLSRIELSEHVPPSGRCDLALAAADVIDALQPLTHERDLKLSLSAPVAGAAEIVGDRDQVLQVIQNLIDNAAKYSAPGASLHVEVGARPSLSAIDALYEPHLADAPGVARLSLASPDRSGAAGGYAFVRVRDQGQGLQREHLPRLAERFYRVEGQKSGPRGGTGLGLAIVKHIVNRHRGGLTVESAPGAGSAFTAYFPSAVERGRAEPAPAASPQAA